MFQGEKTQTFTRFICTRARIGTRRPVPASYVRTSPAVLRVFRVSDLRSTHARSSARSQAHTCESCDARLGVRVVAHQLASAVPVSHTHLLHSTTQRNLISRYLVPGARDQRAFACAEFWISDDRERGGVVGRSCFSCSVEGRMHCKLMRSLSTTESHYHEWELLLFGNTSCSLRSTRMHANGRLVAILQRIGMHVTA